MLRVAPHPRMSLAKWLPIAGGEGAKTTAQQKPNRQSCRVGLALNVFISPGQPWLAVCGITGLQGASRATMSWRSSTVSIRRRRRRRQLSTTSPTSVKTHAAFQTNNHHGCHHAPVLISTASDAANTKKVTAATLAGIRRAEPFTARRTQSMPKTAQSKISNVL